jgi:hypothetical protein
LKQQGRQQQGERHEQLSIMGASNKRVEIPGMPALQMYTRFSANQKFVCDGEKTFLKTSKFL